MLCNAMTEYQLVEYIYSPLFNYALKHSIKGYQKCIYVPST